MRILLSLVLLSFLAFSAYALEKNTLEEVASNSKVKLTDISNEKKNYVLIGEAKSWKAIGLFIEKLKENSEISDVTFENKKLKVVDGRRVNVFLIKFHTK